MAKNKLLLYIIFFFLLFAPVSPPQENRTVVQNRGYAEISLDFLKPEAIFDVLKENLRVPEFKDGKIELPERDAIGKDLSLDIKKYNTGVEEETGVNLLKFFNWLFGLLSRLFASIADFFGNVGNP